MKPGRQANFLSVKIEHRKNDRLVVICFRF